MNKPTGYLLAKSVLTKSSSVARIIEEAVWGLDLPMEFLDRLQATVTHAVTVAQARDPDIQILIQVYLTKGSRMERSPSNAWGFFHSERDVGESGHEIDVTLYPEPRVP